MKLLPLVLFASSVLLPGAPNATKTEYPATYAGGTVALNHQKIHATLAQNEVVFMQSGRRISVPLKNITEISCGTELRPRMGATVLGESETYYVGVSWTGAQSTPAQVVLKMSRSQYRGFLAALERSTGIKAVDTNQVPTVVRYRV